MILCTIRMNGNSWRTRTVQVVSLKARKPYQTQRQDGVEYRNGTWDWGTKWPWDTSVHQVRLLNMQQWTQNCVELMGPDNETLLSQTIYFGWYDGTKHPITCRSIPDQAGIVKHDARYSSLVKKTTFTQKWVKPLPKIGEQFHACVSCQERWGRETLPHAVTNRYPMQPDPQTLNDSFTVSPAKKTLAQKWAKVQEADR